MGAFFHNDKTVTKVLDMVVTLEPIANKFAKAIFFLGTLAAGLSSIFPILMILPLLTADFSRGKLDLKTRQFRILTSVACLAGLSVPALGANPIKAQILTQIFNVFILPLVIICIMILINKNH